MASVLEERARAVGWREQVPRHHTRGASAKQLPDYLDPHMQPERAKNASSGGKHSHRRGTEGQVKRHIEAGYEMPKVWWKSRLRASQHGSRFRSSGSRSSADKASIDDVSCKYEPEHGRAG